MSPRVSTERTDMASDVAARCSTAAMPPVIFSAVAAISDVICAAYRLAAAARVRSAADMAGSPFAAMIRIWAAFLTASAAETAAAFIVLAGCPARARACVATVQGSCAALAAVSIAA
ncbi:uncharacterized protein TEOVI_000806600 [Trypanosoma equiperdum]|uniref:Uncharacterized protein n=1 Tax=Trypanosoma equiperdum TaxID=5694 RepID=A0A1G4I7V2_TRYEQ|nr:hypothetical protein TEOVI_000806600 [Trypanosoma equiperdum]